MKHKSKSSTQPKLQSMINLEQAADHLSSMLSNLEKEKQTSQGEIMSTFASLRTNARLIQVSVEEQRREVQDRRKAMEVHQLKLQNLLYEKNHLLEEIARCQGFEATELNKVHHLDFPSSSEMVSPEQHQTHLNALAQEIEYRKSMQQQLKEMKAKARVFKTTTASKKKFLDGLPDRLVDLEKATEPLQQYMDIVPPISNRMSRQNEAKILPQPLFLVYCEFEAYLDAFHEEPFQLSIVNSSHVMSAPKYFLRRARSPSSARSTDDQNSKRLKRMHQRSPSPAGSMVSNTDKLEEEEEQDEKEQEDFEHEREEESVTGIDFMKPSEKSLILTLSIQQGGKTLTVPIHFHYFPAIQVVGVETPAQPNILTCLFPQDTGQSNPNRSNNYKFEMVLSSSTPKDFVYPANAPARPYAWAQWICGKVHLSSESRRPEPSIKAVLTQIHKRVQSQVSLSQHLAELAKNSAIEIHPAARQLLGRTPSTALEVWKELKERPSSDVFASMSENQNEIIGCRYFSALFRNDEAGLRALVEISPEYPIRAPRFIFQSRSGTSSHDKYENQLKGIEIEVNAYAAELVPSGSENWILMHQLRKVQMCFDVMKSEKTETLMSFGRSRRGKDRRQPIAVNTQDGQLTHR